MGLGVKVIEISKIENIQLTYRNGVSVVLANIINTGSSRTDLILFELTLINKDGSTYTLNFVSKYDIKDFEEKVVKSIKF